MHSAWVHPYDLRTQKIMIRRYLHTDSTMALYRNIRKSSPGLQSTLKEFQTPMLPTAALRIQDPVFKESKARTLPMADSCWRELCG